MVAARVPWSSAVWRPARKAGTCLACQSLNKTNESSANASLLAGWLVLALRRSLVQDPHRNCLRRELRGDKSGQFRPKSICSVQNGWRPGPNLLRAWLRVSFRREIRARSASVVELSSAFSQGSWDNASGDNSALSVSRNPPIKRRKGPLAMLRRPSFGLVTEVRGSRWLKSSCIHQRFIITPSRSVRPRDCRLYLNGASPAGLWRALRA